MLTSTKTARGPLAPVWQVWQKARKQLGTLNELAASEDVSKQTLINRSLRMQETLGGETKGGSENNSLRVVRSQDTTHRPTGVVLWDRRGNGYYAAVFVDGEIVSEAIDAGRDEAIELALEGVA